ncbi:MAG TPA: CADD family putative folate metabolism protein [Actinomycetota bacterium]|nr:CADD family putative folate metabolism protein [Actinomycetota bacterium]
MDLLAAVDELIEERHVLTHPFYTKWAEGTLPKEAIQEYARQYYAFESSFPRFLSAIHSRTEDRRARQSILDNLWDEEAGDDNHAELWLRFSEGMGVSRDDVAKAAPNEATRTLVDTYHRLSRDAPVAAGLAGMYAYERQVPAVAAAKVDGLRTHYGIEDRRALTFWEVHRTLDVDHAAHEGELLAELGKDEPDAVLDATRRALDAWWGFLDAVDVPAPAAA